MLKDHPVTEVFDKFILGETYEHVLLDGTCVSYVLTEKGTHYKEGYSGTHHNCYLSFKEKDSWRVLFLNDYALGQLCYWFKDGKPMW